MLLEDRYLNEDVFVVLLNRHKRSNNVLNQVGTAFGN